MLSGVFAYIDKWINERGSSSILRDRIGLLQQQHDVEVRTLKAERDALQEQVRTLTNERDALRGELQQVKSELQHEKMTVSLMEPLAAKAREMAITVWFRKALLGSGYVLCLQNKTTKPLALNVKVVDATRQRTKEFRVVVDGGSSVGSNFHAAPAKEIGHAEGWAFVSGDSVEVACAGYDSIRKTLSYR